MFLRFFSRFFQIELQVVNLVDVIVVVDTKSFEDRCATLELSRLVFSKGIVYNYQAAFASQRRLGFTIYTAVA